MHLEAGGLAAAIAGGVVVLATSLKAADEGWKIVRRWAGGSTHPMLRRVGPDWQEGTLSDILRRQASMETRIHDIQRLLVSRQASQDRPGRGLEVGDDRQGGFGP